MKKRNVLVIIMVMCLSLTVLLTGCRKDEGADVDQDATVETEETNEDDSKEVKISDGIFEWNDPEVNLFTFLRFNEDGTYYGYFFDGGVVDAGTYEYVEEEMEYISDPGPDGEYNTADDVMGTVPQYIEITSYQDGSKVKYAYDKEADLILDASLGGMSHNTTLEHKADYPYDPAVDEVPIVIHTYYANNREGTALLLNHDRTFLDTTGDVLLEGIWEITGDNEYTLTPDGEEGEYILRVSEDPKFATYTTPAGDIELASEIQDGNQAVVSFTAEEVEVGLPMGVEVRIEGYSDNSAKVLVYVSQVDALMEVDKGTFDLVDGNYVFNFETGGEVTSTDDSLNYTADVVANFGGAETPMTIDTSLTGGAIEGAGQDEIIMTFLAEDAEVGLPMGVDVRIDCYGDGSAKLMVYVEQVDADLLADEGTYTVAEVFNYTFQFNVAGEIAGVPDYASATENSIEVSVPYAAEPSVDFGGNETPLSMDLELQGTVTVG